jgi:hypothetical protein
MCEWRWNEKFIFFCVVMCVIVWTLGYVIPFYSNTGGVNENEMKSKIEKKYVCVYKNGLQFYFIEPYNPLFLSNNMAF